MVKVSQVHLLDRAWVKFDDERMVANAGMGLPALLMQRLGLEDLADRTVSKGFLPGRKLCTVVAGMALGADSIDDLDVLRAGSTRQVLASRAMAPSTVGSWLRSLQIGHIDQLDKVFEQAMVRAWAVGAQPTGERLELDIDSAVHEVFGIQKQGAWWAYNKQYGLHPQYITVRESGEVVACRQRGGRANSARKAASLVTKAVGRVRAAGYEGEIVIGADSAFHNTKVTARCRKLDVRYSITARHTTIVSELIETIPEHAWRSIEYRGGIAQVAESYHGPQAAQRLIVRRVRNHDAHDPQRRLFDTWAYHAFVTDKRGEALELDAQHRRRAAQELVIRDLKDNALAHMPSGSFNANAAWLVLGCLAHNLMRWVAKIGLGTDGMVVARTLRRKLLVIPGRIVRSGRRVTVRMPARWPWEREYLRALRRIRAIPQPK